MQKFQTDHEKEHHWSVGQLATSVMFFLFVYCMNLTKIKHVICKTICF